MSDAGISLGPFVLQGILGKGGMGEVWRAVHRTQRVPVAIKLLFGTVDTESRNQFDREVAAIAGLSHPGVVRVVDAGIVDELAAQRSAGQLDAGARYLAMELASYKSVQENRPRSWAEAVHVTAAVLSGLAHAHAKGLVHRDIKFGNVLLCSSLDQPDRQPADLLDSRPVLSDFGLSITDGESVRSLNHAGTPSYMAPEQVQGHVHRMGPWTDLYQTGVLLWRLCTGKPPLTGPNAHAILFAHLQKKPGRFVPLFDVPDGTEWWLRTCLNKPIDERFGFAAEAREALLALGSVEGGPVPLPSADLESPTTVGHSDVPSHTVRLQGLPGRQLPWTPTTARAETAPPRLGLSDTGLGVLDEREVGPIGRERETEQLWSQLLDVVRERTVRVLTLRGSEGIGRTRLARWLGQTVIERGAALHIELAWDPSDPVRSLRDLLEYLLLARHLDPEEREEAATETLTSMERPSLVEPAIAALSGSDTSIGPMRSLVRKLLGAWSRRQAVVLTLHRGGDCPEGLRLARRLLAAENDGASVLVILSATDPAPASLLSVTAALDAAGGRSMPIGPLTDDAMLGLVQSLADFHPTLEESLIRATAGVPGMVFEHLRNGRRDGTITMGPRGFTASADLRFDAPDDQRWVELVQTLPADKPTARAMRFAALLGMEIDREEWNQICERTDSDAASAERMLLSGGLMLRRPGSDRRLVFAHPAIPSTLVRTANVKRFHGVIAELLYRFEADDGRIAHHRMAAGEYERAFEPLYSAACNQLSRGEARSEALVAQLIACLEALDPPDDDPRWLKLWLTMTWQDLRAGRMDEAEQRAARVEHRARQQNRNTELLRAIRLQMRILETRGDLEGAITLAEEAITLAEADGDVARASGLYLSVGQMWMQQRDYEAARDGIEVALEMAIEQGHTKLRAQCELQLGTVSLREGRPDRALEHLERGRKAAEAAQMHEDLAQIENMRGEVNRKAGDAAGARAAYETAAQIYSELGHAQLVDPVLNLALLQLQDDAHEAAYGQMYRRLGDRIRDEDESVLQLFIRVVLLAATGPMALRDEFHAHLDWISTFLAGSGIADGDVAWCLEHGADGALATADREGARAAYRLAIEHLQRLDRKADAAALYKRVKGGSS